MVTHLQTRHCCCHEHGGYWANIFNTIQHRHMQARRTPKSRTCCKLVIAAATSRPGSEQLCFLAVTYTYYGIYIYICIMGHPKQGAQNGTKAVEQAS